VRRVGAALLAEVPAVGAKLLDHAGAALFFVPWGPGAVDLGAPIIQNVLRVPIQVERIDNDIPDARPGAYVQVPGSRLPMVSLMANIGSLEATVCFTSAASIPTRHRSSNRG